MHTHHTRAMTLVEVLAVVVILGILAATLSLGFSGAFGRGKTELAKTGIGVVVGQLEIYRMETSAWPTMDLGLAALSDGHAKPTDAHYLSPDKLLDPWDHPYQLRVPGPDGHPYEVLSLGADHALGGTGEDTDISSTNLRGRTD